MEKKAGTCVVWIVIAILIFLIILISILKNNVAIFGVLFFIILPIIGFVILALKGIGSYVIFIACCFALFITARGIFSVTKKIAQRKAEKILSEMLAFTSTLPAEIPYEYFSKMLFEKYQHIYVPLYDKKFIIQKVIDAFEEENISKIDFYMKNKLQTVGMIEYDELADDVRMNYGKYCVKDLDQVIQKGAESNAEIISFDNGIRLLKSIGAVKGENFVSREISIK